MIDPEWLAQAAMLSETPLAEGEAPRLAQELGDEHEVLPYLLVTRAAFAEWPAARAALKDAVKAIIRPRVITADAPPSAGQELREACKDALLKAIAESQEYERCTVDETMRLRQRVSRCPQPNDFIATR